jgi:carboxylate-amine ligase
MKEPTFTFGIEEEYLLVDRVSRDLVPEVPRAMLDACEAALGSQVNREYLRCQIEVATRVCREAGEARADLQRLRSTVCRLAAEHGLAPIAASTHPFARWTDQHHTDKERYRAIAEDLQAVGRRLVICGMHVHVGIEDDDLRIDLMNQVRYFMPHLLALSTSSPFWQGENTGLKCYRLAVYNELPRTGLPGRFESWAEYERTVALLVRAGHIQDATKIWWDFRPSSRYPTLEMRGTDISTLIDDGIAIAMIYVCLLRMLYRMRRANMTWRIYPLFLLNENRWRAKRYGITGSLFDFGRGELVAFPQLLEEMLARIAEDADALGCVAEVEHARRILARGTSADRQLACYHRLKGEGASEVEALQGVVDQLTAETASL